MSEKTLLELLKEAWEVDSEIDQNNVDDEVVKLPKLHKKYLDLLTITKLRVFKLQNQFLELKGARSKYYQGSMTKDELDHYGWSQYQGKTPLKSELDRLLEADKILLHAERQLYETKAAFEYAEEIMKNLRYRGQDLKTILEWKKFMAGN